LNTGLLEVEEFPEILVLEQERRLKSSLDAGLRLGLSLDGGIKSDPLNEIVDGLLAEFVVEGGGDGCCPMRDLSIAS
jgi:hypothetical protein